METPSIKVEVYAKAWSQVPSLGSLNTVVIKLNQKSEEFMIDESDGKVLGSYSDSSLPNDPPRRIYLELSDFKTDNVYKHLLSQMHDRVLSQLISDRIVIESERRHELSQGPLFMQVTVDMTHKTYLLVPSYSTTSSVPHKADSEPESCAICLEDFLELTTGSICQLPHCVHLFHETCLLSWLNRQKATCPLCRQGVNGAVESN